MRKDVEQSVRDLAKQQGVELKSLPSSYRSLFEFFCVCGTHHKISLCGLRARKEPLLICTSCAKVKGSALRRQAAVSKMTIRLKELCEKKGVSFQEGSIDSDKRRFKFVCVCGSITEQGYDTGRFDYGVLRCKRCITTTKQEKMVSIVGRTRREWEILFEKFGASILTKGILTNGSKIQFKCSCGESGTIWGRSLLVGSVPRCKSCTSEFLYKGLIARSRNKTSFDRLKIKVGEEGVTLRCTEAEFFKSGRANFDCTRCGSITERAPHLIWKAKHPFMCRSCLKEIYSGSNHPKYNHDIQEEERQNKKRRYPWYRKWIRGVYARYSSTCCVTGIKAHLSTPLSAHHIYNWRDYPELRSSLDNGVLITRSLHHEFHKEFGKGKNTWEQFDAFYRSRTGRSFPGVDPKNQNCTEKTLCGEVIRASSCE